MNHYFIGKILNQDDSSKLKAKQTYLSKNLPSTDKIQNLNTKFAYLGYMDEKTMLELVDKLNNVFEALTENIPPQNCFYKKYSITGKKDKKNVSLLYQNDVIEKIIVPYIRSFTDPITDSKGDFNPHIALVRVDPKDTGKIRHKDKDSKSILHKVKMPEQEEFLVDTIDVMRGDLKVKRRGAPSCADAMDLKVVHQYQLRG